MTTLVDQPSAVSTRRTTVLVLTAAVAVAIAAAQLIALAAVAAGATLFPPLMILVCHWMGSRAGRQTPAW